MMKRQQCQSASWGRRLGLLCVAILSATVVFAGSHQMALGLKIFPSSSPRACSAVLPLGGILPSGTRRSSPVSKTCDALRTSNSTADDLSSSMGVLITQGN